MMLVIVNRMEYFLLQNGARHQSDALCPGQVKEVTKATEHPNAPLVFAKSKFVNLTLIMIRSLILLYCEVLTR